MSSFFAFREVELWASSLPGEHGLERRRALPATPNATVGRPATSCVRGKGKGKEGMLRGEWGGRQQNEEE